MAGILDQMIGAWQGLGAKTHEDVFKYLVAGGMKPDQAMREANRIAGKIETRQGLLESVVPQDAIDVGLMVAGGPGGKMARRVAGGAIAAMNPEDAEAGVAKTAAKKATGAVKGAIETAATTFDELKTFLADKYPNLKIDLSQKKDGPITVNRIVVPEGERGQGIGSSAMRDITAFADQQGQKVTLTPDASLGTPKGKLIDWYSDLGFEMNKGRKKDFEISELMYREPAAAAPNVARARLLDQEMDPGY